jgi:NADH-quinone oxidoreductase subunit N
MTRADLIALLPLLTLSVFCILTMLAIGVRRHHATVAVLSAAGCVGTMATLPIAVTVGSRAVSDLLVFDSAALFYMGLLLSATLVIVGLSYRYLTVHGREAEQSEEFYLLLLLATLGALVLAAAVHFVTLFLGLELIGVSLYGLIGYLRRRRTSLEAALKYVILSGSASAFLLFGMALLYFETGTMVFTEIGAHLLPAAEVPALWLTGFLLVLVGVGFKLGLVPFHWWIPDVYQGAPAPVTAFVATVSKGAVFALLLRFVDDVNALHLGAVVQLFAALAGLTMFVGNFLALLQDNVKRLLAYSSITHFGYVLVAFLAGGPFGAEAVTFYLVAYFIMTLGAFGVVTVLPKEGRDADRIEDYRGLFWSDPWLAGVFILMLLSLAGIPITVGFMGKFYAVAAGLGAGLWLLVILLAFNSAIAVYYYLRLIMIMVEQQVQAPDGGGLQPSGSRWVVVLSLGFVTAMLLWLGVYPGPLMSVIRELFDPILRPIAIS